MQPTAGKPNIQSVSNLMMGHFYPKIFKKQGGNNCHHPQSRYSLVPPIAGDFKPGKCICAQRATPHQKQFVYWVPEKKWCEEILYEPNCKICLCCINWKTKMDPIPPLHLKTSRVSLYHDLCLILLIRWRRQKLLVVVDYLEKAWDRRTKRTCSMYSGRRSHFMKKSLEQCF